ncbi:AraC-like DNA-binding protein [Saliterribacillus persicus]|uniref:AraC-like DNA-binding protein n=1 Tax=Saliterribacillus persicus TaxID=930114 RepID=A0A368XD08_9BACI|nr:AraC-like DNA-binding protein [Saliterribacillus persicus]
MELNHQDRFLLNKHTLFVIPPGTPHRYGADEVNPWSIYWFHVKGEEVLSFITSFHLSEGPLQIPLDSFLEFTDLFEHCYVLLSNKTYSTLYHIKVAQTTRYLLSSLGLSSIRTKEEERKELYLEKTIHYMHHNLSKSPTLLELANVAGLSVQHFNYLFKQEIGYPPIDYFLRIKMQRAGQLLDLTDQTIKEISHGLGINDPYYFSRLFKKVNGSSPTEYRNRKKG